MPTSANASRVLRGASVEDEPYGGDHCSRDHFTHVPGPDHLQIKGATKGLRAVTSSSTRGAAPYPDGSLCLYWPHEWWWRSDCIIAETIIPWTASWLYFYELWLDTGEWLGPSSHSAPKREQPNANTTEHQLSSPDRSVEFESMVRDMRP